MSIRFWQYSTELDAGGRAHGWQFYIELLGFAFELAISRRRK